MSTLLCDVIGSLGLLFVLCCSTVLLCWSMCDMEHCPRTIICFMMFHLYTYVPQVFIFYWERILFLWDIFLGVSLSRKIEYFGTLVHASKVQNIFFSSWIGLTTQSIPISPACVTHPATSQPFTGKTSDFLLHPGGYTSDSPTLTTRDERLSDRGEKQCSVYGWMGKDCPRQTRWANQ